MIDLDAIAARAEAATAGPWGISAKASDALIAYARVRISSDGTVTDISESERDHYGGPVIAESMHPADREHIAGLDPQTVLALVAELRECQDACGNWEAVARVHQDEAIRARQMDAELRAAREAIGLAAAIYEDGNYDPVLFAELGAALAAYHKIVGEASR
jgi:hypothetical protein